MRDNKTRDKNIEILNETLAIANAGKYLYRQGEADSKAVSLKLGREEMKQAIPLPVEKVRELVKDPPYSGPFVMCGRCRFRVINTDSFSAAVEISKEYLFSHDGHKQLVLNFASPTTPGGGVRNGARSQEEDLCRQSTLLVSLESENAKAMYEYGRENRSFLNSDYMILSPEVEIFRDAAGELLETPVVASVLTTAAPDLSRKRPSHGFSDAEIEKVIYDRIMGMLQVATTYGYKYLVLGAWGCGVFGNDADTMAKLFYRAFKAIRCGRLDVGSLFDRVDFAVLDRSEEKYNFKSFKKYFNHFYRDEDEAVKQEAMNRKKENEKWLNPIRGSLIGGAAGDALGYPVEFSSLKQIQKKYSARGITEYSLDKKTGKALISDDTQMTLFTANAILSGVTCINLKGISAPANVYLHCAYRDWLATQSGAKAENEDAIKSWLYYVEELHARRSPGDTCMSALESGKMGTIDDPINDSKGCGGIMRVSPIGLYYTRPKPLFGAVAAAITHGHPLGYMPAAALVQIINRIAYGECPKGDSLYDIVDECCDVLYESFPENEYLRELIDIIGLAVSLSRAETPDTENIARIGQGWVAEEALAIALYCSLKYYDDFSAAIIAAVNHDGDSDSIGSITGNIVGAHIGYDKIPEKWKRDLELRDTIIEIADDLCHDCQMSEFSTYIDKKWGRKYGIPGLFFVNHSLRGTEFIEDEDHDS